jgi:hypothetical protein
MTRALDQVVQVFRSQINAFMGSHFQALGLVELDSGTTFSVTLRHLALKAAKVAFSSWQFPLEWLAFDQ